MAQRLDGKRIQPRDLTPAVYEGASIVENIVLASSNHLRDFIGLAEGETLAGPIPRFVTRRNPTLDNYFADLLLRTCYLPVDYLPAYEEHVIRGSQEELPSALNPRLVGAVLLGIGGQSTNPDFHKVYDEHAAEGRRTARSAAEVVFNAHFSRFTERPGTQAVQRVLEEVSTIDAGGGAGGDHLTKYAQNLNLAQFRQPGFVAEPLEPQWKRAILGAVLMASCLTVPLLEKYKNKDALEDLQNEFDLYLRKARAARKEGFLSNVRESAERWVRDIILRPNEAQIGGHVSLFTLRRILFALRNVWQTNVVSFVLGFLLEATLQAQESFADVMERGVPVRPVSDSFVFVYYHKQPHDIQPNRAILARMNNENKGVVAVVYDPVRQITACFSNQPNKRTSKTALPYRIWKRFVDLLVAREHDCWYVLTQDDGKIARFALNGTDSFVGVPMTELTEEDLFGLFSEAVGAA
jgi:hypothetical protein